MFVRMSSMFFGCFFIFTAQGMCRMMRPAMLQARRALPQLSSINKFLPASLQRPMSTQINAGKRLATALFIESFIKIYEMDSKRLCFLLKDEDLREIFIPAVIKKGGVHGEILEKLMMSDPELNEYASAYIKK